MSYTGWLCYGGMEIVNNCRVGVYAGNGWKPSHATVKGCGCCGDPDDMAKALGQPGGKYNSPGTDKAPWFSTTEPESGDFGGLLVTSVTDLGPGQFTRTTTPRANGRGSFLGSGQQPGAVIVVRGYLIGKTCCAADYGFRWLSQVLRSACGDDCDGADLTFLDCCPPLCDDSPDFVSYEDCLAPYLRTLKGVAVTSSPRIIDRLGNSCGDCGCGGCPIMQVEFTLSSTEPCVFRDPVLVESGVIFEPGLPESPCPEWVVVADGATCTTDPCDETEDCLSAICATPTSPPKPPAVLNPCVCDPMTTAQVCINIPGNLLPEYAEAVPVVTVHSGSAPLHQVRIRFWVNPLSLPVSELDPCDACGEVTIAGIPMDSTFTMDGTMNSVTVTCPGTGEQDATPLLGSAGGRLPFRFPEIPCGGVAYTACVEAEYGTAVEREGLLFVPASVDLSLVIREC